VAHTVGLAERDVVWRGLVDQQVVRAEVLGDVQVRQAVAAMSWAARARVQPVLASGGTA